MPSEPARGTTEPQTMTSVIASDMKVTGECRAKGTLRVDGRVEGRIRGERSVVVTRTGVVEGDLTSPEAVVGGTVRGTLQCEVRVELEPTGRLEGELRSPVARVRDGAQIDGFVDVGEVPRAAGAADADQDEPLTRVRSAS